jgi:hypothetical protein
LAQTYISMSPPPAAFVPPPVVAPRTPTPSPGKDQREVTIQKAVDKKSNAGIEKDRLAGSP